jgi:hypothetical protein
MELIKHIFGLCGEPHLNIFTLIVSTPIAIYFTYYINQLFK